MSVGFIFGGNTNETPESLKRKREMIEAMIMGQRTPQNWGEGAGALLKGIAAGVERGRLNKAEQAGQSTSNDLKSRLVKMLIGDTNPDIFGGQSTSGNIPMTGAAGELAATSPGGGMNYRDAIVSIESAGSGDYAAIGPRHPKMGRALGRYQIMESNIGPWSREALGREVTPDEFMADPKLQDAIFDRKFGSYVEKYGPEGAAQAWFGGPGGVGKTNRKDVLGTSIGGYGQKFIKALGPGGGEVAASTPETAFSAVMPELGGGSSLSDEVSAFQQTPEYRQQFPGMESQGFDAGRFGDPTFGAQPVQGREALALALANGQQQNDGQQAIDNQMQAGGIPQQFQDSQQLMNAQGGMMPALMGGDPATEQQLAQAQARGQQQMDAGKVDMGLLMQVISDPFMDAGMKQLANAMLQQEMQKRDPSHQLDMDYRRAQIDKLNRDASAEKRQPLINAGGGAIYDPNTGEWLRPPAEDGGNGAFRFGGNSVEAQALNGLMDSGQLTPEQAQQLGAGKTITGPNGEIIFLTPQGVFGSAPDGKTQRLSSEGIPADNSGIPLGNITITEPKVTLDERKAMGFADRMSTSGALIDGNEKAGLKPWDQFVRGNDWIPDFAENWLVGEDFQKFDQARRDFVNAQLRRESGAVISDEEFGNANQQYFPQPGDTEDVLRQKAQNRKVVIDGMKRDAGPTYRGIGVDPLAEARKAIAAGADRNAVIQRLRQNGIDPGGL